MEQVNVAVGVIVDGSKILISSRPLDKSYSNYWEFPGGKVELNEIPADALVRELHEELNITAVEFNLFEKISHTYKDKTVFLHVFIVNKFDGTPRPMEKQMFFWHDVSDKLLLSPLLPTTAIILDKVKLHLESRPI